MSSLLVITGLITSMSCTTDWLSVLHFCTIECISQEDSKYAQHAWLSMIKKELSVKVLILLR